MTFCLLAPGAAVMDTEHVPLLEREAQLASLGEYAGEATCGDGRMVLVAGEAGVGKSALVEQVKANADYMAQHLKQHGWQYVVIDIQWSEPNAQAHGYRPGAQLSMDEYGRLIPAVNRFPSSAGGRGFRPLADYIH